jgi:hypothetical protein
VTCNAAPATKADFYTPWMAANNIIPNTPPVQLIEGPDAVANFKFTILKTCPAGITQGPGDKCYQLNWEDPTGSPFDAPANFYLVTLTRASSAPDFTAARRAATAYCPASPGLGVEPSEQIIFNADCSPTATPPITSCTQLPMATSELATDNWRFSYQLTDLLPKKQTVLVRLCGGWCTQDLSQSRSTNTTELPSKSRPIRVILRRFAHDNRHAHLVEWSAGG